MFLNIFNFNIKVDGDFLVFSLEFLALMDINATTNSRKPYSRCKQAEWQPPWLDCPQVKYTVLWIQLRSKLIYPNNALSPLRIFNIGRP